MEKIDIIRMREKWDNSGDYYDETHNTGADLKKWSNLLTDYISKEDQVIDIACGTGFLTILMEQMGYEVTGLDNSIGMMEKAKKNAKEFGINLKLKEASLYDTKCVDNSYDVLTNKSVMWTLLQPEAALKEWNRIVKPGGKILTFTVINPEGSPKHDFSHYDLDIEEKLSLKHAEREDYRKLFEDCGLFQQVQFIRLGNMNLPEKQDVHGANWYLIVAYTKKTSY